MGFTIAIAGKGGTGKTTIAALLAKMLKEAKKGSLLVVDADPNSNLAEALGLQAEATIGKILDDVGEHPEKIPVSMPKDRYIEYEIHKAIQESDGLDLLTMGKPEGPGCYCYVNNVLRSVMSKLIKDYDYIVIDNEAGLEHLSRRTTAEADVLLAVSDATPVGLKAVRRISELVAELKIKTKKKLLLINRLDKAIEREKIKGLDLDYIGSIPQDKKITEISLGAGSLLDLDKNAKSMKALERIGEKIWS
ncbi:MAG: carbon monoxide dehydrogenase [Candidatus Omnitrophica bacterium]|nr:carbon monoxide dehydrogenase [Candidatus Omnitrophota bacterium]